ncbi:hypothetical protein EUX98_g6264 [Antrodiella citrinella]|uniref:Uncharacterized protein n=1 Tax=Antrodiella citrinella TaxID=2447956 RepID=A0A4S4MQ98_9APHY|nr:hypothetical protein EUX98_g6264 [Antrodiella citrinella]
MADQPPQDAQFIARPSQEQPPAPAPAPLISSQSQSASSQSQPAEVELSQAGPTKTSWNNPTDTALVNHLLDAKNSANKD